MKLILRSLHKQIDATDDFTERLIVGASVIPLIWLLFSFNIFSVVATAASAVWWVTRIMYKNGNL